MVDGGTIDGDDLERRHARSGAAFVRRQPWARPGGATPGRLRNVVISGVRAVGATETSSIAGLPGHPIEGVAIENVRIVTAGGSWRHVPLDVPERAFRYPEVTMFGTLPSFGLYVRHARDVTVRNVQLSAEQRDVRPALVADDVTGLHVVGLDGPPAEGDAPAVWLNNVRGGIVETGSATDDGRTILRVTGEDTERITLAGNVHLGLDSIDRATEVEPTAVQHAARPFGVARR
jgi:hypothetical protein